MAALVGDEFEIYSGNDPETLALQAIGAVGVISVMSHVMGDLLLEQFTAFESGNIARAREIQFLERRLQAALLTNNPIPIKAAVRLLGFNVGAPRAPLRAASADEENRVREALGELGAL
jgi:4-hydroxy-tetrahydrodipicolinate synthase